MGISRPEASFKFELADVSKFFETNCTHYSDMFWCRGVQWSLCVESKLLVGTKSMGFFLRCENEDPVKWSCKAEFQLILFSKLSGKPNHVHRICHIFDRKMSWGNPLFKSYSALTNKRNGYIEDDKILLGVQLKAEPVVRG